MLAIQKIESLQKELLKHLHHPQYLPISFFSIGNAIRDFLWSWPSCFMNLD